MISNEQLINAIRSKGFEFKRQADRVMIWKQRGSTRRVTIRRHANHDLKYAQIVLVEAGFTQPEIADFLKACGYSLN